jgi:hypothetical protein
VLDIHKTYYTHLDEHGLGPLLKICYLQLVS